MSLNCEENRTIGTITEINLEEAMLLETHSELIPGGINTSKNGDLCPIMEKEMQRVIDKVPKPNFQFAWKAPSDGVKRSLKAPRSMPPPTRSVAEIQTERKKLEQQKEEKMKQLQDLEIKKKKMERKEQKKMQKKMEKQKQFADFVAVLESDHETIDTSVEILTEREMKVQEKEQVPSSESQEDETWLFSPIHISRVEGKEDSWLSEDEEEETMHVVETPMKRSVEIDGVYEILPIIQEEKKPGWKRDEPISIASGDELDFVYEMNDPSHLQIRNQINQTGELKIVKMNVKAEDKDGRSFRLRTSTKGTIRVSIKEEGSEKFIKLREKNLQMRDLCEKLGREQQKKKEKKKKQKVSKKSRKVKK